MTVELKLSDKNEIVMDNVDFEAAYILWQMKYSFNVPISLEIASKSTTVLATEDIGGDIIFGDRQHSDNEIHVMEFLSRRCQSKGFDEK